MNTQEKLKAIRDTIRSKVRAIDLLELELEAQYAYLAKLEEQETAERMGVRP